jgi:cell division protein FtsB
MQGTMGFWGYVKRAILPAICILLMLYFLSFAIGGPTGVLSWRGFEAERRELAAQVAARAEEKAALQKQVELLDPAGVDPDLADELVRRNLNVVKPDEVIVPLDPEK